MGIFKKKGCGCNKTTKPARSNETRLIKNQSGRKKKKIIRRIV